MSATKTGTLRVPRATLYYEVHGSGPLLLIIQGGAGDAGHSHSLVTHLADHYTVVTYDRRGLSRSTLDDPAEVLSLETHADDVHQLLAALAAEPALVFGTSLGALVGLDLTARHPDQVHTLVAHEPPAPELLPDAERTRAIRTQEDVEQAYRREGTAAAMPKMLAMIGASFDDREPDAELPAPTARRTANMEFFLANDFPAVRSYRLDIAALAAVPVRVVPAAGRTSRELADHRCAAALAGRLGVQLAEFPGGHAGSTTHPRGFAASLRDVLAGSPQI